MQGERTVVKTNEQGYRIGDSNPACRRPDELVRRARDMREHEGRTAAEIATQLDVPLDTVRKWLQYTSRNQCVRVGEIERPRRSRQGT